MSRPKHVTKIFGEHHEYGVCPSFYYGVPVVSYDTKSKHLASYRTYICYLLAGKDRSLCMEVMKERKS